LVARIHVRAFVSIDLDGYVELIDELGERGIVVAFAIDYVAPVAPDRADVEKNGFVFGAGAFKRFAGCGSVTKIPFGCAPVG